MGTLLRCERHTVTTQQCRIHRQPLSRHSFAGCDAVAAGRRPGITRQQFVARVRGRKAHGRSRISSARRGRRSFDARSRALVPPPRHVCEGRFFWSLSGRRQNPLCSNDLAAGHLQDAIDSRESSISTASSPVFATRRASATPSGNTSLSGQYEGEFARFYASVPKGNGDCNIELSASPLIPSANLADVVFGTLRIVSEIDFVALAVGAARHVGHP